MQSLGMYDSDIKVMSTIIHFQDKPEKRGCYSASNQVLCNVWSYDFNDMTLATA